jgi:hypothetical protein
MSRVRDGQVQSSPDALDEDSISLEATGTVHRSHLQLAPKDCLVKVNETLRSRRDASQDMPLNVNSTIGALHLH